MSNGSVAAKKNEVKFRDESRKAAERSTRLNCKNEKTKEKKIDHLLSFIEWMNRTGSNGKRKMENKMRKNK